MRILRCVSPDNGKENQIKRKSIQKGQLLLDMK